MGQLYEKSEKKRVETQRGEKERKEEKNEQTNERSRLEALLSSS